MVIPKCELLSSGTSKEAQLQPGKARFLQRPASCNKALAFGFPFLFDL